MINVSITRIYMKTQNRNHRALKMALVSYVQQHLRNGQFHCGKGPHTRSFESRNGLQRCGRYAYVGSPYLSNEIGHLASQLDGLSDNNIWVVNPMLEYVQVRIVVYIGWKNAPPDLRKKISETERSYNLRKIIYGSCLWCEELAPQGKITNVIIPLRQVNIVNRTRDRYLTKTCKQ
jgi:hypothetical protein